VNLSDEAVEKLAHAVSRQAENSRRIRELALREMGPVAQLIERQVHRLQVRAVELVEEGALDRATDELQEGILLIAALLNEAPTDLSLRLQLGFIYKTIAQVFDASGQAEQAETYIQRAEDVFHFVKDDVSGDQKTAMDVANAIHGLGNVDQQRGDFVAAIEKYKLAASLYSEHIYAWHDMFVAYYELARRGQVNLEAMRQALNKLKQTGEGAPGLGIQHIARLERILRELEKGRVQPPAQEREKIPQPAGDVIVQVLPEFLSLVIGESDPRVAVFNLNCNIVNKGSARVSVRELEAELTTPESLQLRFRWNVFYDFHPSHLPENRMMTKTAVAHEFEIEAGESTSLGIQFLGPAVEPQHLWVPGEYKFELSGWVIRQPEHDHFDVKTRFSAEIGIFETNQVRYWSGATKTEWDQLNDPDRAVGIPVRIDESSIMVAQAQRRSEGHS
jgi:tetratricopeptide (TPR) repeat protein